ncbi:hypothetical protein MGYG_00720 [Nannizzia gypsea CBS 118893]|uniref:Uncharacterized protein n=1 Tax=Arthroderma gypseum (strain ATCC MYA-4604 / CBS 118893) TaxID=535722 RepID=E5R1D0_ARTGP|nr:hypothetical protein MGYG_00720 [Nannizzia gypsea CBS 118893]EFQ97681.1 hypothetical protein MGYG_00720 [Nannizzia gypsea CBS 118893]
MAQCQTCGQNKPKALCILTDLDAPQDSNITRLSSCLPLNTCAPPLLDMTFPLGLPALQKQGYRDGILFAEIIYSLLAFSIHTNVFRKVPGRAPLSVPSL